MKSRNDKSTLRFSKRLRTIRKIVLMMNKPIIKPIIAPTIAGMASKIRAKLSSIRSEIS